MPDRRTITALFAAAPFARPVPRLDIPDPGIDPFETGDTVLFGISPDASVLVGQDADDRVVFLDAETRSPISESDAVPKLIIFPDTGVVWSPDGSRIAFDLQGWRLQRDSDIFVADVTSGDVTNLTPEGHDNEADNLITEPDVEIDTSPVWLDDDTIVFARHRIDDRDALTCDLCTLTVSTGQVTTLLNLAESGIVFVSSNMWRLSDGSLVFLAVFNGRDIRRGAAMVTPDGEVTDIQPGFLETVDYLSVNDTHLIAFDVQEFAWWYMPLDGSMDPTPLWEHFPLPDGWTMIVDPILGPEPGSMFTVLRTDQDTLTAQRYIDQRPIALGQLEGDFDRATAYWADGYILLVGKTNSWLISQQGPGH